jgi:hypothetical protein
MCFICREVTRSRGEIQHLLSGQPRSEGEGKVQPDTVLRLHMLLVSTSGKRSMGTYYLNSLLVLTKACGFLQVWFLLLAKLYRENSQWPLHR